MNSQLKFVISQDLSADDRHGFSIPIESPTKKSLVIRQGVLPGMLGYPDMYIRHIKTTFHNQPLFIISMTDYELTDAKRQEIITGAAEFLQI